MARSRSIIGPIHLHPTITETAVPMAGLKVPPEAFAGRTRSVIEPISPYPVPPEEATDLTGGAALVPDALVRVIRNQLESVPAPDLSPAERAVLRGWARGQSEHDSAAELHWTADAVREARSRLLSRLRITFDPSST
jgi:hypothetical protein